MRPLVLSRGLPNLIPLRCRSLVRPFDWRTFTSSRTWYLHDDTKRPDSALREGSGENHAPAQCSSESQDVRGNTQSSKESSSLKEDVPTIAKARKVSEAQRIAFRANLEKGRAGRDKYREMQRALGFPNLRKVIEAQRALGFPGAKKGHEMQRALGYPNLAKALEASRNSDFAGVKKAREADLKVQRALRFPILSKARQASSEASHARLVREIEAVNRRRLAEDPAFVPTPLPAYLGRKDWPYSQKRTIPCPKPGCKSKLSSHESLERHPRTKHSSYSEATPHKCQDPSCYRYFATEKEVGKHMRVSHLKKVKCSICDRNFARQGGLNQHLWKIHGMTV